MENYQTMVVIEQCQSIIDSSHLIKLRTTINADRSQSIFPAISSITVVANRAGQCIAENLNIPKRKHSIPVEITIFNLG